MLWFLFKTPSTILWIITNWTFNSLQKVLKMFIINFDTQISSQHVSENFCQFLWCEIRNFNLSSFSTLQLYDGCYCTLYTLSYYTNKMVWEIIDHQTTYDFFWKFYGRMTLNTVKYAPWHHRNEKNAVLRMVARIPLHTLQSLWCY